MTKDHLYLLVFLLLATGAILTSRKSTPVVHIDKVGPTYTLDGKPFLRFDDSINAGCERLDLTVIRGAKPDPTAGGRQVFYYYRCTTDPVTVAVQ